MATNWALDRAATGLLGAAVDRNVDVRVRFRLTQGGTICADAVCRSTVVGMRLLESFVLIKWPGQVNHCTIETNTETISSPFSRHKRQTDQNHLQ